MNTEQERAFIEWRTNHDPRKYPAERDAFMAGWDAGRAALHSQDREDAATEATGGDENGGHRLVEPDHETALALADAPRSLRNYVAALRSAIAAAPTPPAARAALQSQDREGWKEAAIAWEVCASLHRDYAKGRDPLFKTRQSDFVKHAEDSRLKALSPCSTEDKTDAERYRWLRNSAGFLALPYIDHGGGPEFPSGSELDAAIDHARRVEGGGK